MESVETRTTYWLSTVINATICSIICIVLLSIHLRRYCKYEICNTTRQQIGLQDNLQQQRLMNQCISFVSLLTIVLLTLPIIISFLCVSIDAFTSFQLFCHRIAIKLATGSYQLGKTFMYTVFILRLYSVYNDTAFAFNKYLLFVCGSLVVVVSLAISVSGIYLAEPTKYEYHIFDKTKYQCTGTYPYYQLAVFGINEVVVTVVALCAFIWPLRSMMRLPRQTSDECDSRTRITDSFRRVSIKVSVLTMFAMCSSLLTLILIGVTKSTGIAAVDMIINSICVMLLCRYYRRSYESICCCCIACCFRYTANKPSSELDASRIEDLAGIPDSLKLTINDNTNTTRVN